MSELGNYLMFDRLENDRNFRLHEQFEDTEYYNATVRTNHLDGWN